MYNIIKRFGIHVLWHENGSGNVPLLRVLRIKAYELRFLSQF